MVSFIRIDDGRRLEAEAGVPAMQTLVLLTFNNVQVADKIFIKGTDWKALLTKLRQNQLLASFADSLKPPKTTTISCLMHSWTLWSSCSATCGKGIRKRTATVVKSNDSHRCSGQQAQTCNSGDCPIHCKLSFWSPKTICSKSCGTGVQTRSRSIILAAVDGGKLCSGLRMEANDCNTFACPVDCVLSKWTKWSQCSHTCGDAASQTHTRDVKVVPRYGGKKCGSLVAARSCNNQACPVDCLVGQWSRFGKCNAPCDGGFQLRSRSVITAAEYGGRVCLALENRLSCNTKPCPLHCEHDWNAWSECSRSCGQGSQSRAVNIKVAAAHGGRECPKKQIRSCNSDACPVDCEQSGWSKWTTCSNSCGTGTRQRTRSIIRQVANGGKACLAADLLYHTCNTHACPVDCKVSGWSGWDACSKTCGGGTNTKKRSVIVSASHGGKPCGTVSRIESCSVFACPSDCIVSAWSRWSSCSADCGGGVASRRRTVLLSAANGGKPCPSQKERKSCSLQPCPIDCVHEWLMWSSCSKTCGSGYQAKQLVVKVKQAYGGIVCPKTRQRLCNTDSCATRAPTATPTSTPTPPPTPSKSTPIITMKGDDIMTIEASVNGLYQDPGATCLDAVWGNLDSALKVTGTVDLVVPAIYYLTYSCSNPAPWHMESVKKRTVVVRDTACPVCKLNGNTKMSVEADFTLTDPGATCSDVISGQLSVKQSSDVNVRQVGTYKITYRAKDQAGNWNDACGHTQTVRTVSVVDTLKPVIALSAAGRFIHLGKGGKSASGLANPADSYFHKKIITWDNNKQAGTAPWLMPSAADWANPRNLQKNELACMEQCKKIAACKFGTYMNSGQRRGECWLSAHSAPKVAKCAGSCSGFEVKVTKDLARRLITAEDNRGYLLKQSAQLWLPVVGVVVVAIIAIYRVPSVSARLVSDLV